MNADQREAVRENAKYLRNVRPLDPDEISEYVTGQPHPAAVRQVLRESAVELGLVERADGRFEPVADGPLDVAFDGVAAFPDSCGRVLDERLVERYGPDWPAGESGARIRERVRTVKAAYLRGDPVEYDAETALCYALYHLPDYYAAVQYVLAELVDARLLDRDLRVLDVGAGVGGPALGLADFLPENALVGYHAVEPSEAADVLDRLLSETGRNVRATVHRTTAEAFDPRRDVEWFDADERFDLVVFANVLSELDDPAGVVEAYADALAEDGTVVGLAPADRNTALGLRAVERTVADEGPLTVYAPTVRLWPGYAPTDECWSFDARPDLAVPAFQERLAEAADGDPEEFVNVDVQYAYSLLRRDGRRRYDVDLDASQVARFADADTHVTERVDCYAAKLSHDLSDGGNPLYRVADGSQRTAHFAVLTRETALNDVLGQADYGDLLRFENVLVLWNDDERAYNLVVDDETIVDPIPG
ncbi:SAM-dependent methyltransferase [Halobacteriales archaeon QH_10_67_22]|nr:MAG: SAM-dependent methyltransferase [Halobacteriales archaeon QH_10_67_22]